MGLFDKKYCDICGNKIGLLGNRKLEDGNMCKDCAAKLSPWFEDRKASTVEEIKQQLAYREENKAVLAYFNTTRELGRYMKVYVDENAGKFFATSSTNIAEANPDVVDMSQIQDVTINISESRHEERREVKKPDGKTERVSYNPPRYTFSYDFIVNILVDTPYFDRMRVRLNNTSVRIESLEGYDPTPLLGRALSNQSVREATIGIAGYTSLPVDLRMTSDEYMKFNFMAEEIRDTLLAGRNNAYAQYEPVQEDLYVSPEIDEVQATSQEVPEVPYAEMIAIGTPVKCPHCEADTVMTEDGLCEYCGMPLNG